MEPRTLNSTYRPTAASTLREPSKVRLRFAAPHQSETAAAALFLAMATKVQQPTDPAAPRDATPVSRFPSSKRAGWVHPSPQYRHPSASDPTNAASLAENLSAGQEAQSADNHVPMAR